MSSEVDWDAAVLTAAEWFKQEITGYGEPAYNEEYYVLRARELISNVRTHERAIETD